jgi:hypothetical protein
LSDKSSRVREKAADQALTLHLSELTADLQRALSVETRDDTKGTIEFSLRLLRDGYILEDEDADRIFITFLATYGITSHSVSREDLDTKGLEAIIREVNYPRL